jgi:hypothetical protein
MTPQIPRDYLLRTGTERPYPALDFSAIWQRLMAKYVKSGGERFTFHDLRAKAATGAGLGNRREELYDFPTLEKQKGRRAA